MDKRKRQHSNKKRGLYPKFEVFRIDKSPKHKECFYFVIDVDHDVFAAPALEAYAKACEEDYPLLAKELMEIVNVKKGIEF